jgi:hypothetical protein
MTGLAFAVYRTDGKQENYVFTITDYFDQEPVTLRTLDSIRKASKEDFLKTRMLLSKRTSISFTKELTLKDFRLTPGQYTLQMIYFCGRKIFKVINLNEDSREGKKIFQGCALSQRIPLTVR